MSEAGDGGVGVLVGAIGVLRTWKRDLGYHPHVHFLVPGGGLDFVNERWLPARNHFFVRQSLALARELLAADHKARQPLVGQVQPFDADGDAQRGQARRRCGEPLRLTATIRPRSRCPS